MGRFSISAFILLVLVSFLADVAAVVLNEVIKNPGLDYQVREVLSTIRPYPWRAALFGVLFGLVVIGFDTQNRRAGASGIFKLLFLPPLFNFCLLFVIPFALGRIPHFPLDPNMIAVGVYAAVLALVVNESVFVGYGPGTVVFAGFAGALVASAAHLPAPYNVGSNYFYTVVGAVLAYPFAKDN